MRNNGFREFHENKTLKIEKKILNTYRPKELKNQVENREM